MTNSRPPLKLGPFEFDSRLFVGLPVGLVYHVLFCVAVAAIMALLVAVDETATADGN